MEPTRRPAEPSAFFSETRYKSTGAAALDNRPHTHSGRFEILQCFSNGGNIVIKDRIYPMYDHAVYLINAINVHKTAPAEPERYTRSLLQFQSGRLMQLFEDMGAGRIVDRLFIENGGCCIRLSEDAAAETDSLIRRICAPAGNPAGGVPAEVEKTALTLSLVGRLYALYEKNPPEPPADTAVSRILDYINQNLKNNITLGSVAEAVFIDRYYLCHLFKKQVGMTVAQYILARRLSYAKKQLLYTGNTISETAADSGFNSSAYFSCVFKRAEGLTPGAYRRQNAAPRSKP